MAALPQAFIDHIQQQQNFSATEMEQFCQLSAQPLRKSVRFNRNKISLAEFHQLAQQLAWTLEPIPWCNEGFWISPKDPQMEHTLGNHVEHLQGLFYIQESSSMLPVKVIEHFAPEAQILLDMAAAPGSKTTQLAGHFIAPAAIVANELSSSRIKGLHANIQRCGIDNVILTHQDGRILGEQLNATFDAILLDAPCGGEGTVRKDPDAMKNWSTQALHTISEVQKALIESAYLALKPGGLLVYSTCTLSFEENQFVCQHLLERHQDMSAIDLKQCFADASRCITPEGFLHVFPHTYNSEGFFVAAFRKAGEMKVTPPLEAPKKWPYRRASQKLCQQLKPVFQHLGFESSNFFDNLWSRDDTLWYFPAVTTTIASQIKIQRSGIKVAEIHRSGIRLAHDFIIAFATDFSQPKLELSAELARDYLRGVDLRVPDAIPENYERVAFYRGQPLGLVKSLKGKLKNRLPRPLVRDNPIFK